MQEPQAVEDRSEQTKIETKERRREVFVEQKREELPLPRVVMDEDWETTSQYDEYGPREATETSPQQTREQ